MQAPKVQQTKEAKALAAANSSKGKKKVSLSGLVRVLPSGSGLYSNLGNIAIDRFFISVFRLLLILVLGLRQTAKGWMGSRHSGKFVSAAVGFCKKHEGIYCDSC